MPVRIILNIISSFLIFIPGIAQIYSPDPHYSDTVQYSPFKDSVFVFNEPDYGDRISITLAVESPNSTDGWAFVWSKYDTALLDYTGFLATSGTRSEVDTITTFAGYRVIRSKGAITDTSQVWVIFHDYKAEIDTVNGVNFTCSTISITSFEPYGSYYYYIPGYDSTITITTTYQISWEKDTEEGSYPASRFINALVTNPPYENTTYVQKLKDTRFGLERTDSLYFIAIRSKAELGIDTVALYNSDYYPENYGNYYGTRYYNTLEAGEYPGPAKFKFFDNGSRNTAKYYLNFGDDEDTTFYSADDTIIHEYYFPGTYKAVLFTYAPKPLECVDSTFIERTIANPFDSLVFPNVFTPNGDGDNDYFRIHDISIYSISIVIFNRYGKKVHEYSGNIRDWEGWDGRIMDSKRRASEGIYYYVVDAVIAFEYIEKEGIKVKSYNNKKQRSGFVYLFIGDDSVNE
ncbi:MAG: gliding motility-associated C-terminal domain-containing protein [Bacteroidales bacterium]|nr:gliding motility-associated C-terminal domain-containing protein [Bacteroidales bacterium]